MVKHSYSALMAASVCILLAACGGSSSSHSNLYDLPSGQTHPDYDSYYTQPTNFKGCALINDAPSCGGG
jgi:uncharacterized lipoprotein YmbA